MKSIFFFAGAALGGLLGYWAAVLGEPYFADQPGVNPLIPNTLVLSFLFAILGSIAALMLYLALKERLPGKSVSNIAVVFLVLGVVLSAAGIQGMVNSQASLQEANDFFYRTASGFEGLIGGYSLASHAENVRQLFAGSIIVTVVGGLMALGGVIRLAIRS